MWTAGLLCTINVFSALCNMSQWNKRPGRVALGLFLHVSQQTVLGGQRGWVQHTISDSDQQFTLFSRQGSWFSCRHQLLVRGKRASSGEYAVGTNLFQEGYLFCSHGCILCDTFNTGDPTAFKHTELCAHAKFSTVSLLRTNVHCLLALRTHSCAFWSILVLSWVFKKPKVTSESWMISRLVINTLVLLNRNSSQADAGKHLSVRHPWKHAGKGLSYVFN